MKKLLKQLGFKILSYLIVPFALLACLVGDRLMGMYDYCHARSKNG